MSNIYIYFFILIICNIYLPIKINRFLIVNNKIYLINLFFSCFYFMYIQILLINIWCVVSLKVCLIKLYYYQDTINNYYSILLLKMLM